MNYCAACQQTIATTVVLDLDAGSLSGTQHLCADCAEKMGYAQPKPQKHAPDLLNELLDGVSQLATTSRRAREQGCPGCGLSQADFRRKARLGCPRCYETFRDDLLPLLHRIHEAQSHRGRLPATLGEVAPSTQHDARLTELRNQLEDAVRNERYEEAARVRDALRKAEHGARGGA